MLVHYVLRTNAFINEIKVPPSDVSQIIKINVMVAENDTRNTLREKCSSNIINKSSIPLEMSDNITFMNIFQLEQELATFKLPIFYKELKNHPCVFNTGLICARSHVHDRFLMWHNVRTIEMVWLMKKHQRMFLWFFFISWIVFQMTCYTKFRYENVSIIFIFFLFI